MGGLFITNNLTIGRSMSPLAEARSEYTVLARRFRPQAFAEVVGQEMVAQALRNAIGAGRVAHAYLFTGARGVGKTSMARILAKSLNCPHAQGPDPCNECEICRGISTGSDVDVLEIDGASNRGIDDIRTLRQNVSVKSMRSKHKIYIIDEVHMLTKEAFNALLKTLEEPPANVKFIFCTTEPNKLPDTILSRCQRFDFGTIRTSEIMTRLSQIATAEGRTVERTALELVARRAAGSMRDSQSLFDQVLAFGSETIAADDVHRLLGTAPDQRLIELMDAVISRQRGKVLELFHAALASGVQLGELTDQLLSYVRDLLVLSTGAAGVPLLSVADEKSPLLQQQAGAWGLRTIAAALQILADTKGRMQRVNYGRPLAELALIRLSLLEDLDSLEQLIQQVKSGAPTGGNAAPAGARPMPAASGGGGTPRSAAPPERAPSDRRLSLPPAAMPGEPPAPRAAPPSDSPQVAHAPQVAQAAVADPESADPPFRLEPGTEMEFWAQVTASITDMLRDNARKAASAAISGPNLLVLTFSKSYDQCRKFCERPDNVARLEKLVTATAGRPLRIAFKTVEAAPAEHPPEATPKARRPEGLLKRGEVVTDPLVQKVLAEFGGTVVKAERIETARQPSA
jgi:DNA polymerase-3 subunit gamma/tau